MADDVHEDIVDALNAIASSTERSINMRKELKHTIYESVNTLRKLFVKLKEISDGKSRKITELQTLVTTTKAKLDGRRDNSANIHAKPSIAPKRGTATTGWVLAPPGAVTAKHHREGTEKAKLYSEVLGGKPKQTHYKLTVTSRENKSTDTIKDILKSNINPTEIKLGINSLRSLRSRKIQIEVGNKEDNET
jgi:hypothetical protein